ncbi:MAG: hypothetical protein AAB354_10305 [candidate division KSB1 bacterium]
MTEICLISGGAIFGVLGLLHAFYTLLDTKRPRRLAPDNPQVLASMSSSFVRLSRGGSTMWRAWLGFNFSHSLGAILFCFMCIFLALHLPTLALPKAALLLPVAVGLIYFWLAILYWFYIPATGIALGTICLFIAWLVY